MPPWGAVKGFGDFRNDQALTPEQLELIMSWSTGGSPEGEAKDLPSKDKSEEMMKESLWHETERHPDHQPGNSSLGRLQIDEAIRSGWSVSDERSRRRLVPNSRRVS